MDKKVSRKFFNERAEHWDETVRNNDPVRLQDMADRLNIGADSWVLDVGTGTGVFVPYISGKLNGSGKITCMDYAINMLFKAVDKNPRHDRLNYICSEIETLRFPQHIFDVAMCYSTFPHFHDKPKALRNLSNLLKIGGTIYICHTASKEAINEIHRNIPGFQDHLLPENGDIHQLLTEAGFSGVSVEDKEEYYLVTAINQDHNM